MADDPHPHLAQAPITEAILDIGVAADAQLDATDAFARRVAERYPEASPVSTMEAVFSMTPGNSGVAESKSATIGRICWNAEKTRAVQARINGFTVNHVKHYESWDVLRAQAVQMWAEYLNSVHPKRVLRVALRYINRIRISAEGELGQYMNTYPSIGPQLPREMGNVFMRVEIPFTPNRIAIITQVVSPKGLGASERDLIFDVDAVSSMEFEPRDPEIWNEFDKLREIKNQCFFGSVQDHVLRRYR